MTSSAMCRTTCRLCEMKRYAMPISCCRSMRRLSTCAWIDTSSADTGSSATTSRGCSISARATAIRCRCPPENMCG